MPRSHKVAAIIAFIIPALFAVIAEAENVSNVLVFSPHPDDETIACGGAIQKAIASGQNIKVVFITNGDAFRASEMLAEKSVRSKWEKFVNYGEHRQAESLAALRRLGVLPENAVFLGYPDSGLLFMWETNWDASDPFWSRYTRSAASPYENSYRPRAPYTGQSLLRDICAILCETQPSEIFVPHPDDSHPDHMAAHAFVMYAIERLRMELKEAFSPEVKTFIVHSRRWPESGEFKTDEELSPPPDLTKAGYEFDSVQLTAEQAEAKLLALKEYGSQLSLRERFLSGFIRENELFWRLHPISVEKDDGIVIDGDDSDWHGVEPTMVDPLRNETLLRYLLGEPTAYLSFRSDNENLYVMARIPNSRRAKQYEITFRPVLPVSEPDLFCAIDIVFTQTGIESAKLVSSAVSGSRLDHVFVKATEEFAEVQVPRKYFQEANEFLLAFKTCNSSQEIQNRTGYRLVAFP